MKTEFWHLKTEFWLLKTEFWHLKMEFWHLKTEFLKFSTFRHLQVVFYNNLRWFASELQYLKKISGHGECKTDIILCLPEGISVIGGRRHSI